MILKFLSLKDVFLLKFLPKRFYQISSLKNKLRYFSINSRKIFGVNEYYDVFYCMFNDLLNNLKIKFDETTFLFLKYSLEDLKNLFMISNSLYHLFSCPRSVFARNDCFYCSRVFIKEINQPKNFNCINEFNFNIFFKQFIRRKLSSASLNILSKLNIIVFFKSYDEFSTVNSNRKRCLNTFIVQDYIHLVLAFFEIQLGILINFFYNIVKEIYFKTDVEIRFFLEECFNFSFDFVTNCISKVKISFFEEIFDEINYNEFDSNIIKVINKKYIEYCDRKYIS